MLIVIVLVISFYIVKITKKNEEFEKANKSIEALNVLQDFMKVMGQDINTSQKVSKLNDILIQGYNLQFSSIVTFDGVGYGVKTSNVPAEQWEYLTELHTDSEFAESISTANIKYLKSENEQTLKYSSAIQRQIKSAMFFPLYIDNVYIGYWIIESTDLNAFDSIEQGNMEIIKTNMSLLLQTIGYQEAIQNMVVEDTFTGLKSRDYLFAEGKNILNSNIVSTVVLFEITNLVDINEKLGRESGNMSLTEMKNRVSEHLADTTIFVRYMGPKFAIAFPGMQVEDVMEILNNIKQALEDKKVKAKGRKYAQLETCFVGGTYYKGTGLDTLMKRLDNKLEEIKSENTIVTI